MKSKIKEMIIKNKRWLITFICAIIFCLLLENILDNEIVVFDSYIYLLIIKLKTEVVTRIFKIFTFFGSAIALVLACVLCCIFIKNRKIQLYVASNLIVSAILNFILKNIIKRDRPIDFRLISESGYSFPSGHSMVSMAFYGLITYIIFKKIKNKYLKIVLCTLMSMFILSIGISRIYLGVHYASDVLAGFVISISYLMLITHLIKSEL